MLAFFITIAAATECGGDTAERAVEEAALARQAFLDLDEAAFQAAQIRLDVVLPCTARPLTTEELVQLHQAKALSAYLEGAFPAVTESFAAIKTRDPSFQPALELPETHPLMALFREATTTGAVTTLQRAPAGGWQVDSESTYDVPTDRAFFLQGYGAEGELLHAGYHRALVTVPDLGMPVGKRRRTIIRWAGTGAATAMLAGSIGSYVAAGSLAREVRTAPISVSNVETLARKSNALTATSIGLFVGSATAAATTWTLRW